MKKRDQPEWMTDGRSVGYSDEDRQSQFQGDGYYCIPQERGKLEIARQIAALESPRTTGLYDRREDDVSLDEVETIWI